MSLLIIVAIIAFIVWVIDMHKRVPEQSPITTEITKQPPPVAEEITPVPPPAEVVPQPVTRVIQKKKIPVPEEIKKEKEPFTETVKKEEPATEEVTKAKESVMEKTAKEISSLQEKCEKQSKKIFSKQYNNGSVENSTGLFLYKYKHHYNKKLNKCFMVITEDGDLERYKKLLDVDENNSYGSVRINNDRENMGCYLLNKKCSSEDGWDSIVKSYMEE